MYHGNHAFKMGTAVQIHNIGGLCLSRESCVPPPSSSLGQTAQGYKTSRGQRYNSRQAQLFYFISDKRRRVIHDDQLIKIFGIYSLFANYKAAMWNPYCNPSVLQAVPIFPLQLLW